MFATLVLCVGMLLPSKAQQVEISAGGGWALPTNNVEATSASGDNTLAIDLTPGPHAYATGGFVRTLGDRFSFGARLRTQVSRLRSTIEACENGECQNPEGLFRAVTAEGRILLTMSDRIQPYLLIGLGVVNAQVDEVTVENTTYQEVTVTDAGGDFGIGTSILVVGGLYVDAEVRITGTLPGGKKNAVTKLPLALGVSYRFE